MTKGRWQRMWTAFHHARSLPCAERDAWLAQELADDPDLHREVADLLGVPEQAGAPPITADTIERMLSDVSPERLINTHIGPYQLLEVVGEGGMGVVYAAQQRQPLARKVAFKIIKIGMDTREVVARFESERQALAMMDHPNIAKVLDAGATESGRPYFVMDFVEGVPLTAYCRDHGLDLRQRCQLFVGVLEGIQHAHQKGIIHRDLKPSNILVNRQGQPIIIDFGLVKALSGPLSDRSESTIHGQVLGTPAYMSPEQAALAGGKIDTRSDIYSLGVVLYELLTGARPYDGIIDTTDFTQLAQVLASHEPLKPSQCQAKGGGDLRLALSEKIPADIDWIVFKAMAKSVNGRYANARDFANDMRCFLAYRPVSAGPPSVRYRLAKFVRRHRLGVTFGLLSALGLLLALAGLSVGMVQAQKARDLAMAEQHKAQQVNQFLLTVLGGASPYIAKGVDTTLLRNMLDAASQQLEQTLSAQPVLAAEVHDQLAEINREVGFYDVALRHGQRAYQLRDQHLGDDDPLTLRSQGLVGLVLWDMGELERSVTAQQASLDGLTQALGPYHLDTLSAQGNLALALKAQRQIDRAAELYRDLIEKARHHLGASDRLTLLYQSNYAALLRDSQRADEAEALIADSAQRAARQFGQADPDTIIWHDIWGDVLLQLGRLEQAESVQRVAMAQAETVFGPAHQTTIGVRATRAKILQRMGRHQEAQAIYRQALPVIQDSFGSDHRYSLILMRDLGASLRASQDYQAAADIFSSLLATDPQALPPRHPIRLRAAMEGGLVLLALGQEQAGIGLLQQHYAEVVAMVGPDHELVVEVKQQLDRLGVAPGSAPPH